MSEPPASRPLRGVVVAHAGLAEALIGAAERISGVRGALVGVSNEGVGAEELLARVREACEGRPAILFADLASGSCALAGRLVARDEPGLAVLTGVNLPMLLDFVFHREMALSVLLERLVEKGRGEVQAHRTARGGEEPRADRPLPH